MIRSFRNGSVGAEIGVWRGYFSSEILCQPNIARLYSIDNWGPYIGENQVKNEAEARHNLNGFGYRSHIIKGNSVEVARDFNVELDFLYIDADHTKDGALADFRAWSKKLKPNGILAGHDYVDHPDFGVIAAVQQFCDEDGWRMVGLTREEYPSFELVRNNWTGAEL